MRALEEATITGLEFGFRVFTFIFSRCLLSAFIDGVEEPKLLGSVLEELRFRFEYVAVSFSVCRFHSLFAFVYPTK